MFAETKINTSEIFAGPDAPRTLVELLRLRAHRQPELVAYTFLTEGESEPVTLTYAQLDRAARAIAAGALQISMQPKKAAIYSSPGG